MAAKKSKDSKIRELQRELRELRSNTKLIMDENKRLLAQNCDVNQQAWEYHRALNTANAQHNESLSRANTAIQQIDGFLNEVLFRSSKKDEHIFLLENHCRLLASLVESNDKIHASKDAINDTQSFDHHRKAAGEAEHAFFEYQNDIRPGISSVPSSTQTMDSNEGYKAGTYPMPANSPSNWASISFQETIASELREASDYVQAAKDLRSVLGAAAATVGLSGVPGASGKG